MNRWSHLWFLAALSIALVITDRQANDVQSTIRARRIELVSPEGDVVGVIAGDRTGATIELRGAKEYVARINPTRFTLLQGGRSFAQVGAGGGTSYMALSGAAGLPSCLLEVTEEGVGQVTAVDNQGSGWMLGPKGLVATQITVSRDK